MGFPFSSRCAAGGLGVEDAVLMILTIDRWICGRWEWIANENVFLMLFQDLLVALMLMRLEDKGVDE